MVRRGTESDYPDCLAIAGDLTEYFNEHGLQNLSRDLPHHALWVATTHKRIAGFCTVLTKSPYVAEITWLAVAKPHQGQGIGSALLAHLGADLGRAGVELLAVKTLAATEGYPPYEATRHFYEKHTFRWVETVDPYPDWDPGNPCAIYIKTLG